MWQTKYAATIPKNLGVGVNFRPCSEGYFLSGCPQSVGGQVRGQMPKNANVIFEGSLTRIQLITAMQETRLVILMLRQGALSYNLKSIETYTNAPLPIERTSIMIALILTNFECNIYSFLIFFISCSTCQKVLMMTMVLTMVLTGL